MAVVLKLGGSVLTDKDAPETVDEAALAACASAVSEAPSDLLLVHGGGSFGHYHAERHGVSTTAGTDDPRAVAAIHGAMRRLNAAVVGALHDRDVPAVGVEPLSAAHRDVEGGLALATGPVRTMLARGAVPVVFGDLVADAANGFTVVSGDELAVSLAAALEADRVGMCSGVPGVLDEDGAVLDRIASLDDVEAALVDGDGFDVTGGMAGKVRALLGLAVPAYVFGLEDLPAFLDGEAVGTAVGPA